MMFKPFDQKPFPGKCIAIFFFPLFMFFSCKHTDSTPAENIKAEAEKMSSAFLKEDFSTVADYTSPVILTLIGGKERMIEGLKKSVGEMKLQGMSFQAISFDDPSGVVEYNKELQATIAQKTEIRYAGGKLTSTSVLIAISGDNGKSWKFIDISDKDTATIRKSIPNLSPSLYIPAGRRAVQQPD